MEMPSLLFYLHISLDNPKNKPIFAQKIVAMITDELQKLYVRHAGCEPEQIDELPSSGSNRRYFRLKGRESVLSLV